MASLAHTTRRPSHVRAHLSAYLAGLGATSALTAGAVVAFLSLATFVAFNGLPFGGPEQRRRSRLSQLERERLAHVGRDGARGGSRRCGQGPVPAAYGRAASCGPAPADPPV